MVLLPNANGDIFCEYQDNFSEILKFTREKGIRAHASVVLMDKNALHNLLSNPKTGPDSSLIFNIL